MQYFKSRQEAGQLLADKLEAHKAENCAVIALSEGGVLIGAEIAKRLHASVYMLATQEINLPREILPIATMSSAGTFTYNHGVSPAQLEEWTNDYRSYIDQERLKAFQKLNRVVGKDGEIDKRLLSRHTVIFVSDGFNSGLSLDVAADFIKPVSVKKLIVAAPIATVQAIDRMHLLADEIYFLGIIDNYFSTDHYYDNNEIPEHETVVDIMKNIVLSW